MSLNREDFLKKQQYAERTKSGASWNVIPDKILQIACLEKPALYFGYIGQALEETKASVLFVYRLFLKVPESESWFVGLVRDKGILEYLKHIHAVVCEKFEKNGRDLGCLTDLELYVFNNNSPKKNLWGGWNPSVRVLVPVAVKDDNLKKWVSGILSGGVKENSNGEKTFELGINYSTYIAIRTAFEMVLEERGLKDSNVISIYDGYFKIQKLSANYQAYKTATHKVDFNINFDGNSLIPANKDIFFNSNFFNFDMLEGLYEDMKFNISKDLLYVKESDFLDYARPVIYYFEKEYGILYKEKSIEKIGGSSGSSTGRASYENPYNKSFEPKADEDIPF